MQQLTLDLAPPPPPTLENFVPGANVQVVSALRAALAGGVSERRLCLWGGPGCGKTHLLRAAGGHYLACAGAVLERDLACTDMATPLALDDVDALDDPGQVALFNLINRRDADAASGRLLVSCSLPPAETHMRADLASRLAQGLVLEVAALSDNEKAEALNRHAALRGMLLPTEVTRYLLAHLARDLPTLIAVLDALDRISLERQRPVTLHLLREALQLPPDALR